MPAPPFQHIKFPSVDERKLLAAEVAREHHLPFVYAAVDGTHIRIPKPCKSFAEPLMPEVFYNRKHYFSVNVSLMVDASYRVLWFLSR